MIRTLQVVDWGLAAPFPVAIHERISILAGFNGSGKSSAMDALKALLGVNRFGQNRTAASYIHDGRDVTAPASEAFVLACCTEPDRAGQLSFSDDRGDFTLLLWVTRSRRAFMALPGHLLLGMDGRSLAEDLDALKERYPRRGWYSPEDYQRRVLDPLGATRAVQRILSIPQGQAQRLLDARPDQLLSNLLSIMGALEPLNELEARRGDYQHASQERDRAHRALLEEQVRTANAERELAADNRLHAAQQALDCVLARARGAARQAAADADQAAQEAAGQISGLLDRQSELAAELAAAQERDRQRAQAPGVIADARRAAEQLSAGGADAQIPLDVLSDADLSAEQLAVLHDELLCAVVVPDVAWAQALAVADEFEQVTFACAPDALTLCREALQGAGDLEGRGGHVLAGGRILRPRRPQLLASSGDEPDTDTLREQAWDCERSLRDLRRQAEQAQTQAEQARRVAGRFGDGDIHDAAADQLPGLTAEADRLQADCDALVKAERRRAERQRQLDRQRERLAEAEQFLSGQDGALETARAALGEARDVYRRQVRQLIADLDTHFRSLCADAGMRGELELTEDPLAEAGGRLNVRVAETLDGTLRAYADADLSGGWRAKTAVLVLLAALCAAGGQHALGVVLLDEHAAAMDEARIDEVGWVMQGLARERGLQMVLTMPTRRASEAVSWADLQIAYLKIEAGQQYAPLPHLIEADEHATRPPVV